MHTIYATSIDLKPIYLIYSFALITNLASTSFAYDLLQVAVVAKVTAVMAFMLMAGLAVHAGQATPIILCVAHVGNAT